LLPGSGGSPTRPAVRHSSASRDDNQRCERAGRLINNDGVSESVGVFPPAVGPDPLRASLDCLREGFQIIGFDWTYVYVNPAAARHGRREAAELIGSPIATAYPGIETTPLFEVMRRCMSERTSHVMENLFTFP